MSLTFGATVFFFQNAKLSHGQETYNSGFYVLCRTDVGLDDERKRSETKKRRPEKKESDEMS